MKSLFIVFVVIFLLISAGFGASKFINVDRLGGRPGLDSFGNLKTNTSKSGDTTQKQVIVEIKNSTFTPAEIKIKEGTVVTFRNRDEISHSATSDDEIFDTGLLSKNQESKETFTKKGIYAYHCTPHPNMKAKIIVE